MSIQAVSKFDFLFEAQVNVILTTVMQMELEIAGIRQEYPLQEYPKFRCASK